MTHIIGSGDLYDPTNDAPVPYHGKHDPIAYTYEVDVHCPACTFKRFGADSDGWIAMHPEFSVPLTDGEDNPVGVIAPWDEWQQFDGENETLACSDCGAVLDTYEMTEPGRWEA